MRTLLFLILILSAPLLSCSQQLIFVKDSIMNAYMESGFATKNFRPEGPVDDKNRRQGAWKDYEVVKEGSYQLKDLFPLKTISMYLFYGEGDYQDGKRTGDWKMYVIEDKSFRKILSQTLTYKDGIREGAFTYYYPDGNPAQKGYYKDGLIEGKTNLLFPGGSIAANQFYQADKKDGRQEYLYPDGKLNYYYEYKNGLKHGKYESFYPDGKTQESFSHVADSIDGTYRYYYPSGQLWTETFYRNGRMMNITGTYDEHGKARNKGTLKDGNGTVNYYTEDGKIYLVVTFKDGIKVKEEDR